MFVHRLNPKTPITEPGDDYDARQRERNRSLFNKRDDFPIGTEFPELCCRCRAVTTWVQRRGFQCCTVCRDRFPCRGDCRCVPCQYFWAGWALPPHVGKYRKVLDKGGIGWGES